MKRIFIFIVACLFWQLSYGVEIYGHRGAAGLAPENTLEAYRTAIDLGVDVIDMDVGITKDGVVVVYHNATLNPDITRNPNGEWISQETALKTLSYQHLKQLNVGAINPHSEYAATFPLQVSKEYESIPTLREVIQYANSRDPNIRFQIEIKTNPTRRHVSTEPNIIVPEIVKILREEQVANRTEIHSFEWENLLLLEKLAPEITRSYLTAREYYTSKDAAKWSYGHLPNQHQSIPAVIKALNGHIWCPEYKEINAEDVKKAHDLGLKVTVWSVDHPEDMLRMIQYGVDGIITNRPDLLRGLLAAKNLVKKPNKSLKQC